MQQIYKLNEEQLHLTPAASVLQLPPFPPRPLSKELGGRGEVWGGH